MTSLDDHKAQLEAIKSKRQRIDNGWVEVPTFEKLQTLDVSE